MRSQLFWLITNRSVAQSLQWSFEVSGSGGGYREEQSFKRMLLSMSCHAGHIALRHILVGSHQAVRDPLDEGAGGLAPAVARVATAGSLIVRRRVSKTGRWA